MKKLALTVGIILLVMVFFACGGSSSISGEEAEEVTEETEEKAEAIAEEEEEETEPERDEEGYKILSEGIKEKGGWYYITSGVYQFGDILENKEYYYFEVVEGEGWLWFDSWEENVDQFDEYDDMLFLTKGQHITLSPEENDTLNIFAFKEEKGFTVKCF